MPPHFLGYLFDLIFCFFHLTNSQVNLSNNFLDLFKCFDKKQTFFTNQKKKKKKKKPYLPHHVLQMVHLIDVLVVLLSWKLVCDWRSEPNQCTRENCSRGERWQTHIPTSHLFALTGFFICMGQVFFKKNNTFICLRPLGRWVPPTQHNSPMQESVAWAIISLILHGS